MSPKTKVVTEDAPPASSIMSQAIVCNNTVYCSGSLGLDPKTGTLVDGTVYDRTKQSLKNLKTILEAAGSSLGSVCKVSIFISNFEAYDRVNEAYAEFFTEDPKPCRTCVVVAQLPMHTDVEIDCIATTL